MPEDIELRPYPNEHSCRLADPGKFVRFVRNNCAQKHNGKCIDVIYGYPKTGDGEIQALRYKTKIWTAITARSHCSSRDGSFEAASEKKSDENTGIEYRHLLKAELRLQDENGKKKIIGHAAIFNSLSEELWGFKERVMPGAFKRTLAEGADVRALINHNPSLVLGRNKAGTLTLKEDERGLFASIDPPDTTAGRDIIESINRKDIDGMSIGFRSVDERWIKEDGMNIRELIDVDLFDISVVTYPAYTTTEVMIRSLPQMARDLSGIFIRTEKGLELDADDRSIIDKAIVRLQNLRQVETPNLDERLQKLDILKK